MEGRRVDLPDHRLKPEARAIFDNMIVSSPHLRALEAAYQRDAFAGMTFEDAVGRFAALWAEAKALRPDLGTDWEADLAPDLAVARALNGLPPSA